MRKELQEINGKRTAFTAIVDRFGTKSSFRGPPLPTICLKDVKDSTGKVVTDHLWFTVGKTLKALELQPGDKITFDARVTEYYKGYKGHRDDYDLPPVEKDYRLSLPTKVKKND